MAGLVVRIALGFVPVLTFLLVLFLFDNFRLVQMRSLLRHLLAGCLVAVACLFIYRWLQGWLQMNPAAYARYLAPLIEEAGKASYLALLFRRRRVGFMVDAAIVGFSIGAGFALFENIYYLYALTTSTPLTWVIRGFGTAVMHGGNVALVGILAKTLSERRRVERLTHLLPGLGLAVLIHALFNQMMLRLQFLASLIFLVGLPLLVVFVYSSSERSLRKWLEAGFSSDVELLEMIRTGTVLQSNLGQYLQSLKDRIPGEILADMLCYLRIFIELSIKAKGILLLAEAGFDIPADPEVKEKFQELRYLEKSIGKIGKRLLAPFLHTSTRDLWQLHMLQSQASA